MISPPPADDYVNPFGIPVGARSHQDRPLCPWLEAEHEARYVDVDDTEEAFRRFRAALTEPGEVRRSGWFVSVTGPDGCGKTSVINRCAHWLTGALKRAGVEAHIYDFTFEGTGRTMDKRIEIVCDRLVSKAINEGHVAAHVADQLLKYADDLSKAASPLSDYIGDDTALILLMPPTDLAEEMRRYWAATRRKLIIFTESSYEDVAEACAQDLGESSQADVIHLRVGPLESGNGRAFSEARMRAADVGRLYPALDPDAPDNMIEARLGVQGTSIRFIQKLLFGVYEELRGQEWPNGGTVTFIELANYIIGQIKKL